MSSLEIQKNILQIEKYIKKKIDAETRLGLYDGLSGLILFYDNMFQAYNTAEFEKKLHQIIEKTNTIIETDTSTINLCSGIAGYGIALLRLKTKSIDMSETRMLNFLRRI